jgi:hypothetical protein
LSAVLLPRLGHDPDFCSTTVGAPSIVTETMSNLTQTFSNTDGSSKHTVPWRDSFTRNVTMALCHQTSQPLLGN